MRSMVIIAAVLSLVFSSGCMFFSPISNSVGVRLGSKQYEEADMDAVSVVEGFFESELLETLVAGVGVSYNTGDDADGYNTKVYALYKIPLSTGLALRVGGGVDYETFEAEDDDITIDSALGLELMAGVEISLAETLKLQGGIRHGISNTEAESESTSTSADVDLNPDTFFVGVAIGF